MTLKSIVWKLVVALLVSLGLLGRMEPACALGARKPTRKPGR
jgi:hypothetical protein